MWVDADGDPRSAVRIVDGLAERVDLPFWLPRNPGPVRLVTLQVLDGPDAVLPADAVRRVADEVRLPPGTVAVNVLVPVDRLAPVSTDAVHDSQVNILVQPVDGSTPVSATEPLTVRSPMFPAHGAAALATAAGLWTGMAAAPLDAERPWSGTLLAVARSYHRRLDATPVVDRLAAEVFGRDGTLPVTRSSLGEPLGVVAAQAPAAEAAARAVLDKHASVTRFHPPPVFRPPPSTRLSFGGAAKMFASFVGRALLHSPQNWARAMLEAAKNRIETGTTSWMFGNESRYAVVLNGLQPGGGDQATALQHSAQALLGLAQGSEPPSVAAAELWNDTVRTAASLVDGGHPVTGVPLPTQGSLRLVLDDPSRVVPAPGTPAFPVPAEAPGGRSGPIAANDPYHALQVERELDRVAADLGAGTGPGVAQAAAVQRLRSDLHHWREQHRSFGVGIGVGLASELEQARLMQADVLQPVPELTEEELQAPLRAQARARRMVFVWLGVLVLLLGGGGALWGNGLIGGGVFAGVVVVSLLFCVLGAIASFQRGQRALFKALYRLDVQAARRTWLREHAVTVTQEVVRLAGLYRQSRMWSDVLAQHVHQPFGRLTDQVAGGFPSTLSGDLPLAMSVATARFSPDEHEAVVYQARGQMLRPGWLAEQIRRRQNLVLAQVERRTGRQLESRLGSDVELGAEGPLASYLHGLRDPDLQALAREAAIARLIETVDGQTSGTASDRLLSLVRVDAGAMRGDHDWASVAAPLTQPVDQLAHEGFSATGITNGSSRVARTFLAAYPAPVREGFTTMAVPPSLGRHQLDRTVIRLDLSRPVPLDDLASFGESGQQPPPAAQGGSVIDVRA
ncbi:hypothetical protein JL107_08565 [Nakamurella flavida]|uniref:Uncharacterized protein n=1 Tax=Nakamurella flavida TaxID=363630 RepID=A0A939C2X6_9ACTN|nr:hypothetical protein [Nakamurella flavida]MBM9476491.1 hypothetical protein [Nakamurella flavida]MDP9779073.1 hypothetical protein [Nakamurella flavida]